MPKYICTKCGFEKPCEFTYAGPIEDPHKCPVEGNYIAHWTADTAAQEPAAASGGEIRCGFNSVGASDMLWKETFHKP